MRKWLLFEICMLAIILLVAVLACVGISTDAFAPNSLPDTTTLETPETTQTTQTTEADPTWMTFSADRELTAQQAFVYDCEAEGFFYLSGGEEDSVYPASVTKLFTAYVALQFLEESQMVTAGDALDMVGAGSSVAEIQKGDVLTVSQLVAGMLLPSGNDASYILAAEAGWVLKGNPNLSAPQAVEAFLKEMNGQARALGMSGTHFTNPDGYHDPDHYTSIRDLVKIGKLALAHPVIADAAGVYEAEVKYQDRYFRWETTNQLLIPGNPYECPYAVGLKTGQTPSAGSCLLSAFDVEGHVYIIGVFGCPEIEDRFEDTLQLFNRAMGLE